MNTVRICQSCKKPLPADAPEGLCPECLVKVALGSGVNPSGTPSGAPTTPSPVAGFAPAETLSLDEVAKLFPQLEILELLGQGGMGVVYKARQKQLDRIVALKIMLPQFSRDPAFVERFNREARALAKLNHPNIVAIYDFGQTAAPQTPDAIPHPPLCFFIMEFVDGANLRSVIQSGKLTAVEALAIVPKLCDALQFAHDEGVVHRDIKPANILVDKRGRVKIADFGLAKLAGATDVSLTRSQQGMGTPQYMAPEQLSDAKSVDHRADIYSLGVVFYEMLTGELPMGRFALPSQKVQIDVRLDEIVLKALEREPARRYQHASEVRTQVENVTSTPDAKAPTPTLAAMPASPVSNDENESEAERSVFADWGGRIIALAAIVLAFGNRWGVKAWYFFAAGCAIYGVLSAFGIGRRKTSQSQLPTGAEAKSLDHRVSEALTVGLPGWFNRRALWVQKLIQAVLTIVVACATMVVLGFNIQSKTDVTAGQAVTNSGAIQIGMPWPWFSLDFSSTHHGYSIHWLSASLWIGLAGVAVGCLSERLRRSRPGFDEVADRRKRRRWMVVMVVVAVLYVAGLVVNGLIMSGATGKAARSVMERATDAVPSLGTITDGFGAEFTVPAGQVAIFEIVTRKNGVTVPIPNLAAYVVAPTGQPSKGTFRWSREVVDFSSGQRRQPWRIEVRTPGDGKVSSGGLDLPEALEPVVGSMGLGLGLKPDDENIHWTGPNKGNPPTDGLVGLRVRTQPHGIKAGDPGSAGASGAATIDWMSGAKVKPAATNTKPASAATELLRKVDEKYGKLSTFSATGKNISLVTPESGGAATTLEQTFSLNLARPEFYRVEWTNGVKGLGTLLTGAAWSAGDGHKVLMNGNVSTFLNREMSLATATGVSGGAAHTVPSLFFKDDESNLLKSLTNATLLPEESVGADLCHVITGDGPAGKYTLWITKKDLFLKQSRTAHAANSGLGTASATDQVSPETMRKLMKTLGQDASPEAFSKMTNQMAAMKQKAGAMQITITETFERITANELMIKEDFEVTVPAAAAAPTSKKP